MLAQLFILFLSLPQLSILWKGRLEHESIQKAC